MCEERDVAMVDAGRMIFSSHPGPLALATISGPSVVATPDQLFIIGKDKDKDKD